METLNVVVITSINSDASEASQRLISSCESFDLPVVVVADQKTPEWKLRDNILFMNLKLQNQRFNEISSLLPLNHYSRKNLGYLQAHLMNAQSILDTDDDNFLTKNPWNYSKSLCISNKSEDWINVYRFFGENQLWPRGFPLDRVYAKLPETEPSNNFPEVTCFQSLVDGDPDIDAIGRLLFRKQVVFEENPPFVLNQGICPTNSQATLWSRWIFPLLYLPSTATFRMTDIWRGLILQPAVTLLGGNTLFGKLGFIQKRNTHDLLKDFESESIGHIETKTIVRVSSKVWKSGDFTRDALSLLSGLKEIYSELVRVGILDELELRILNEWTKYFGNHS